MIFLLYPKQSLYLFPQAADSLLQLIDNKSFLGFGIHKCLNNQTVIHFIQAVVLLSLRNRLNSHIVSNFLQKGLRYFNRLKRFRERIGLSVEKEVSICSIVCRFSWVPVFSDLALVYFVDFVVVEAMPTLSIEDVGVVVAAVCAARVNEDRV